VGLEVENIYEALDHKGSKERIYKIPLFDDEDEHIFYTPLSAYKAHRPFITLGITPLKKFESPSTTQNKKTTQSSVVIKKTSTSGEKEKVVTKEVVRTENRSNSHDFTLSEKFNQLKTYLVNDVKGFEKDDN
jgi:hypothetical protein